MEELVEQLEMADALLREVEAKTAARIEELERERDALASGIVKDGDDWLARFTSEKARADVAEAKLREAVGLATFAMKYAEAWYAKHGYTAIPLSQVTEEFMKARATLARLTGEAHGGDDE